MVFSEKNYHPLLVSDQYGTHFYDEIIARSWSYLVHNNNDVYCPSLVEEFYSSITNIDLDSGYILLNWRNKVWAIDLHIISNLTDIPQGASTLPSEELSFYRSLMGPDCVLSRDRGIKGTSMYRNVFTACRWACQNITSNTHNTSFRTVEMGIVHSLMTRDRTYCMCRRLLTTIGEGHQRSSQPLPCLVTTICKHFMAYESFWVYEADMLPCTVERETSSYRGTIADLWTPPEMEDAMQSSESSEDSATFWAQSTPENSDEHRSRMWGGMKRLNSKLNKALSDRGESSSRRR